jgi:hypothetical protein
MYIPHKKIILPDDPKIDVLKRVEENKKVPVEEWANNLSKDLSTHKD